MKSKYKKIKYTNTGVKAPVVTLLKSSPELDRSDMIKLNFPEMNVSIIRVSRKTMYSRAQSLISVSKDGNSSIFYIYDTINDARVIVENFYLHQKILNYLCKNNDPIKYDLYCTWESLINDQAKRNPELYKEIGGLINAKKS